MPSGSLRARRAPHCEDTDSKRTTTLATTYPLGCSGASSDRLVSWETDADTEPCDVRHHHPAIAFHLEGLREQGQPVPSPTAVAAVMVTTPAA